MASREWASRVAFNRAEQQYLAPPDEDEGALCECGRCGRLLFAGDKVFEDFDGKEVCEDCITEEVEDRSRELEESEPDWDSMPGGADYCDW